MKHQAYVTRALKARDPRYARIFQKMGYQTADLADEGPIDIEGLRSLYEEVVGKKPFNGWGAEVLRQKIAEKRAEG